MTDLQPIFIREVVLRATRKFFEQQNFHEVIVPVFNEALPLEPNIYSFETIWQTNEGNQKLFLTTSPESGIKKMLALGVENCYSIGKCFRNLENSGTRHNPEFLMLEWYRKNARYQQIIEDTEKLIQFVKSEVDRYLSRDQSSSLTYKDMVVSLHKNWPVLSLETLFAEQAGVKFSEIMSEEGLRSVAQKKGYQVEGATWSQIFDQLFLNEIEVHFTHQPFFLVDFPARLSPLCQVNQEKPYLADRFEVYLAGMEIGNGNNENTDWQAVRTQFEKEKMSRAQQGQHSHPIDEEFLSALQAMSKFSYAGIGLGIDRLAMLMANANELSEVEHFALQVKFK